VRIDLSDALDQVRSGADAIGDHRDGARRHRLVYHEPHGSWLLGSTRMSAA